jgi:hypothetical protein
MTKIPNIYFKWKFFGYFEISTFFKYKNMAAKFIIEKKSFNYCPNEK